ncbi:SRPBCC family protein [Streptomyces sp. NPDC058953]|uniref:SRPBCC family protein n=1 Tax=unclassified Streptomyces TaxID=2593676 RepID=UPI003681C0F4
MTAFRLERTVPAAPSAVWRRVTDWRAHAALIPLTSVVPAGPRPPDTVVGSVFVVRTGIGRAGFDDPMEIVEWSPPGACGVGRCRLEKRGRTIRGWAVIEVRPAGSGSVVVWTEEARVRGVPRRLAALEARVGRAVFGRALDALLRSVGSGASGVSGVSGPDTP